MLSLPQSYQQRLVKGFKEKKVDADQARVYLSDFDSECIHRQASLRVSERADQYLRRADL